jgi:hypothetical protein
MKTFANKWGPVPRTLLDLINECVQEKDIARKIDDTINDAVQNPDAIFKSFRHLNIATIPGSLTVLFIKTISKAISDRG